MTNSAMAGLDIASAAFRAAHTAALMSAFGCFVFALLVSHRSGRLERGSLYFALFTGVAWLCLRSAAIAGARDIGEAALAVAAVAGETQFGRVLLARLGLVACAIPLAAIATRSGNWPNHLAGLLATGTALALQGGLSHAGAIGGPAGERLLVIEAIHVIAAGGWLGALLPLLICLRTAPADLSRRALRRFFPLGAAAVLLLGATSLLQAQSLVASVPALFGTGYGLMALLKLALLALLLVFAALNRFVFGAKPGAGLRRSVTTEAIIGMAVIGTAGLLAHGTPAAHQQPVWPFAWRLNPATTGAWLIPAHTASFYVSPTRFSAESVVHGEQLYRDACAGCHGALGHGDGTHHVELLSPPPDLTARALLDTSDGDLFRRIGHNGEIAADDRWHLADYLRALNRGEYLRTAGRQIMPVQVPRFTVTCADGRSLDFDDLQGRVLRIVFPPAAAPSSPSRSAGLAVQAITADSSAAGEASCVASPDTSRAIAILLGATSETLAGSELLIDPNGWIRARWQPGQPGGWATPDRLRARARTLALHPLPVTLAAAHVH